MEQPKDYEELVAYLDSGYDELTLFSKILYHLQDYIILVIGVSLALGYLLGLTFGKFWV
jgi:hypothetical protein